MGRRLAVPLLAAAALVVLACANPLMDKVKATVAQKDMLPKFSVKTGTGNIAAGGSFGFGSISINTSKDVTFTIENLGTGSLSLTDTPKVSISGTDAALFSVVSHPATPILAGSSTTFVLRFLPTTSGARSATVTIPNNDSANSTFAFSISGTGSIQAAIRVWQDGTEIAPDTGTYSFPQTGLTYSAAGVTFTIQNDGTAILNLTGTPYVQSSSGDFSVVQPGSASVAAGGGTTSFILHFTPSAEGTRTSSIIIPNDDPDRSPFSFTARGIASTVMLAKTGQTTSHTLDQTGDDGALEKGVPWPTTRFSAATYSVIDNLTGLQWARNANLIATSYAGYGLDPDDTIDDGQVTWQHALDLIAYLNTNSFGSCTDWRLPNRAEIRSLINLEETDTTTSAFLTTYFTNVASSTYWSSTSLKSDPLSAWYVSMNNGQSLSMTKATAMYVWPVRGGSGGVVRLQKTGQTTSYATRDDGDLEIGVADPGTRFVDNADGTITDQLTGLMWEESPSVTVADWPTSISTARTTTIGSYNDWRIPNLSELVSLLKAEETSSASYLGAMGFSNLSVTTYWSSSTHAATTANAWVVNLGGGAILSVAKSTTRRVFLVRSPQ